MGKYIGPKTKIARRFGEAIYGADKALDKRNVPPGQHGLAFSSARSRRQSTPTVFWRNSSRALMSRLPVWAVSRVRTC